MKEIFISYSTIDSSQAETVRNVLEKNGLSCWMAPRDIPGGSNYSKEIPVAIRNCKIFVLVLSKNAQSSHWVLKELDAAVNHGKVILPFMLDNCILNDEFNFLLTGAQRYSAYQKTAEAMKLLISRIRGILDAPGAAAPAQDQETDHSATVKLDNINFDGAACSACGSTDLIPQPKLVMRHGLVEYATMLMIPIMAVVCFFAGMLLCLLTNWVEMLFPFIVIGIIGGAIWGNSISKKWVRRYRLRHRISSACYRCKACDKKFRIDIPND